MSVYPSRIQWAVIWGTALTALWMWIMGGPGQRRLRPGATADRRIVAFVVIGALVVWMLSDTEKLRELVAWDDPKRRGLAVFLVIGLGVFVAFLLNIL